ncbi:Competence protein CoiA-like family protein [compost metagenome]|jgi:competence protein CoiA
MLTALVNGLRTSPRPEHKGVCPGCGQRAIPKCGEQVAWHWSHKGRKQCDPWWENETDWHRAWKTCFDINLQEVVQKDAATGEMPIADVKTPIGTVLEFQNSPMDLEEMRSRENFYRNMVWIVNASTFRQNLQIGNVRLPAPSASFLSDVLLMAPIGFFVRQPSPRA